MRIYLREQSAVEHGSHLEEKGGIAQKGEKSLRMAVGRNARCRGQEAVALAICFRTKFQKSLFRRTSPPSVIGTNRLRYIVLMIAR